MRQFLPQCGCGSGKEAWAEFDGHNIFLFYCCESCEKQKFSKYRPDIKEWYECDESIEPEDAY